MTNTTGSAIDSLRASCDILAYNDQNGGNGLNFAWSLDDVTFEAAGNYVGLEITWDTDLPFGLTVAAWLRASAS